ncbi:thioredoxin family protein [Mucilaginibacter robiniae]|uniref:Thioredoxin family protein n=1 Tax=Mucilaginibacter robiniae TaxID=2728022 RepID=A0A7L5E036_9SPHI|nr:hypothetical protein [Mucilaginibacter robiniae]QJD96381.1 thioredoxin family protein [Mucilaginibacter robiniae]
MKKLLFILSLVITAGCSRAQNPPNIQKIPAYHILTNDSVYVTQANLKKNMPVVIIYFSPDCSHCQRMMYEMQPKMKELEKAQIVMITFTPYNMIKGFYRDFGLSRYPNVTVGTEGYTYQVQRYFQVKTTPYIAVYNSKGKLVKAFEKAPKVDELIATIKKA